MAASPEERRSSLLIIWLGKLSNELGKELERDVPDV